MFENTYGTLYKQNAYVFSDLFVSLGRYYTEGKLDLHVELNKFFKNLYRKMFTVYNAQFQFSDS